MMIEEKINAEIKAAMLAKNSTRLEALRGMKSVVLLLKTSPEGLTEETAVKALQKEMKKRKETAELFQQQGRNDLAEVELFQASVFQEFLPQMMNEEQLSLEVAKIIEQLGATSPSDMGKVMGVASKALAGKADGKMISDVVKKILAK
ncbi:MAG: GatB/YqeY domain-containing protein [Bacteroidota bacterium]